MIDSGDYSNAYQYILLWMLNEKCQEKKIGIFVNVTEEEMEMEHVYALWTY